MANVECKDSDVKWFTPGFSYRIENKIVKDVYGTEWPCKESTYTPGFYTAYSRLGNSIATFIEK